MARRKLKNPDATKLSRFLTDRDIRLREIAGIIGRSPQQASNIASRKTPVSSSTEHLQKIAAHYNLPWDYFLERPTYGQPLDDAPEVRSPRGAEPADEPHAVGIPIGDLPRELLQTIVMAIEVLQSGTHYAESLMQNIHSFHGAITDQRKAGDIEARLEQRIADLERRLKKLEPPGEGQAVFQTPGAPRPGSADAPGKGTGEE